MLYHHSSGRNSGFFTRSLREFPSSDFQFPGGPVFSPRVSRVFLSGGPVPCPPFLSRVPCYHAKVIQRCFALFYGGCFFGVYLCKGVVFAYFEVVYFFTIVEFLYVVFYCRARFSVVRWVRLRVVGARGRDSYLVLYCDLWCRYISFRITLGFCFYLFSTLCWSGFDLSIFRERARFGSYGIDVGQRLRSGYFRRDATPFSFGVLRD